MRFFQSLETLSLRQVLALVLVLVLALALVLASADSLEIRLHGSDVSLRHTCDIDS
jgi:hypothetical protein